jgi:hypothetical protein
LEHQLQGFQDEESARLLCWILQPDEQRLFEGFVLERATREQAHDVLLACDEPFSAAAAHGIALVRALEQELEAAAEKLEDADVYDISWTPPPLPSNLARGKGQPAPDQLYLREALMSLREHECSRDGRLTLCLNPQAVADPASYARWLHGLVYLLDDANVRVIASAGHEDSWCAALQTAYPERVRLLVADLNMPLALEEISAAAEDSEEPAGRFRQALVQAANALGRGDSSAARGLCELATTIARNEGWPHLEFAAQQLLASGSLGLGSHSEAFAAFEQAERVTAHDLTQGTNWLTPLFLQARLGKAAAAVAAGAWPLAARLFANEALPLAQALSDRRVELECRRMASYCEERAGNVTLAWKHAVAAVAVGASLSADERRSTTLPFVGQALLRMISGFGHRKQRQAIGRKFASLLGQDWQKLIQPGAASAEDMEASALARQEPPAPAPAAEFDGPPSEVEAEAAPLEATLDAGGMVPYFSTPASDVGAAPGPVDPIWDWPEEPPAAASADPEPAPSPERTLVIPSAGRGEPR